MSEIKDYRRCHALIVLDARNQALGANDDDDCNFTLQRAVLEACSALEAKGWNRADFVGAAMFWWERWKNG